MTANRESDVLSTETTACVTLVRTKGAWGWPTYVAYCLGCRWTCAGHPPRVDEARKEHEDRWVARRVAERNGALVAPMVREVKPDVPF